MSVEHQEVTGDQVMEAFIKDYPTFAGYFSMSREVKAVAVSVITANLYSLPQEKGEYDKSKSPYEKLSQKFKEQMISVVEYSEKWNIPPNTEEIDQRAGVFRKMINGLTQKEALGATRAAMEIDRTINVHR